MPTQFIQRKLVDVQLAGIGVNDSQIIFHAVRQVFNLIKLGRTDVAAEPIAILHDATGIVGADSRDCHEGRGVGRIKYHMLTCLDFMARLTEGLGRIA